MLAHTVQETLSPPSNRESSLYQQSLGLRCPAEGVSACWVSSLPILAVLSLQRLSGLHSTLPGVFMLVPISRGFCILSRLGCVNLLAPPPMTNLFYRGRNSSVPGQERTGPLTVVLWKTDLIFYRSLLPPSSKCQLHRQATEPEHGSFAWNTIKVTFTRFYVQTSP